MCQDGNVNYHNQHILVFCCHNHDLKCILSGKSAKAAMFYISDYITKMGIKTYEMLSLLSRAVARLPSTNHQMPAVDSAKALLHKCLSQFNRQQQIHAQQAARYIQGHDDSISSHQSVPMLSSLLLSYVKNTFIGTGGMKSDMLSTPEDSDNNDDGIEQSQICVSTDKEGNLVDVNQIHHYLHCDDSPVHMNFYDFCRCIKLQTKARSKRTKNTHATRLGVLQRYALKPGHPLHATHELIKHTDALRHMDRELVPLVIGMSIPLSNNKRAWALFALSHFKPFSCDIPLFNRDEDPEDVFNAYAFSDYSQSIMINWEAIHECEDEWDADRLRK